MIDCNNLIHHKTLAKLNHPNMISRMLWLWKIKLEHKWHYTKAEADSIHHTIKEDAKGKSFIDTFKDMIIMEKALDLNPEYLYLMVKTIRLQAMEKVMEDLKQEAWSLHSMEFGKEVFQTEDKKQEPEVKLNEI